MIAQELEVTLHRAFVEAREKRHEFIAVEHLPLALLDNPSASKVLRACTPDTAELRRRIAQHIREQTPRIASDRDVDTQPTLGFQKVIQSAILKVQSSGKKEVADEDLLVAIFDDKKSRAVQLLQEEGVTRLDVVNYISHGIARVPEEGRTPENAEPDAENLQVVLFNDDYTPMQFVVEALKEILSMGEEEAKEVMLEVHRDGKAVCGLYPCETACLIVSQVTAYAKRHGHPLRVETVVQR